MILHLMKTSTKDFSVIKYLCLDLDLSQKVPGCSMFHISFEILAPVFISTDTDQGKNVVCFNWTLDQKTKENHSEDTFD